MKTKVTFPVPRHMTVEQAWLEIQAFGKLHGYSRFKRRFWNPRWATIEIDDGVMAPYDQDAAEDDEWGEMEL